MHSNKLEITLPDRNSVCNPEKKLSNTYKKGGATDAG